MSINRIAWAAVMIAASSGEAFAQSSSEPRIQRLEEAVHSLERRVAALEAQLAEQPASSRVAPDKVNWRKLKRGMTEAEVEQLLGSPSHVNENEHDISWMYRDKSIGVVHFDAKSRKVNSWNEPLR